MPNNSHKKSNSNFRNQKIFTKRREVKNIRWSNRSANWEENKKIKNFFHSYFKWISNLQASFCFYGPIIQTEYIKPENVPILRTKFIELMKHYFSQLSYALEKCSFQYWEIHRNTLMNSFLYSGSSFPDDNFQTSFPIVSFRYGVLTCVRVAKTIPHWRSERGISHTYDIRQHHNVFRFIKHLYSKLTHSYLSKISEKSMKSLPLENWCKKKENVVMNFFFLIPIES